MNGLRPATAALSHTTAVIRLVWPQLIAVALLLILSGTSLWLLSGSRAYLTGESLWAKAQKEAVLHLLHFSRTADPEAHLRFLRSIDVTLGDRQARLEMDRASFDREVVAAGFVRGRNDPDDVNSLIALYRWFRWYPALAHAVNVWREGDAQIDRLLDLAKEVRLRGGSAEREGRILAVNRQLEVLEDDFSQSVATAARQLSVIVVLLQAALAVALVALAWQISRRVIQRASVAEDALSEVAERLELALEGSNDGFWDLHVVDQTLFLSGRFKEHLGYAGHDPIEGLVQSLEIFHPDDRRPARRGLQQVLDGDLALFDMDLRMRTAEGGYRWFHARAKALRDAEGAPRRISGAITDVHERVVASAALAASESLQRGVFEAARDAILVLDTRGIVRSANPAVRAMFGYEPHEVVGRPITLLQPPRTRANHLRGFDQVVAAAVHNLPGARLRVTGLRRDGSEFPLEVSFSEAQIEGERMFPAFLSDVTERDQARQALEVSLQLLDATQTVARVGGWEVDVEDDNRVYWTRQLYTMLELSPDGFQPTVENTRRFFPPESLALVRQFIHNAEVHQLAHDAELEMVTATGRRMWVHSVSHLTVRDGRTVKRVSTLRDITEMKLAQLEREQAERHREEVAHELDLALHGAQMALWAYEPHTGRVTQWTRWEIFGHHQMPATYDDWKLLVHPEDLPRRLELMDSYLRGETDAYESEFRLRTGDGRWTWVRSRGQVVREGTYGEPLQYSGVVMDISAQVAARQVVSDQRLFLEAMVEGIDTGVMISSEVAVVYANASFRRALELPPATEAEEFPVASVYTPADWAREQRRRDSLAAGRPVPSALFNLRSRRGRRVQSAMNLSRVVWNGQPHFISTMTPLTEHAMLQLQLEATHRRFERVLISELEAQQAHIARELHDSLGSELAGLSLLLGGVKSLAKEPQLARQVEFALNQVESSAHVARALARGLMPVSGEAGAFWRALERMTQDLERGKNVTCDFRMEGDFENVPGETGSHLYRIAQEASSNALRHGRATRLDVELARLGSVCTMTIRDNGIGMEPKPDSDESAGLGLRSMQARTKAIAGQLRVAPGPDGGLEVQVQWPAQVRPRTKAAVA